MSAGIERMNRPRVYDARGAGSKWRDPRTGQFVVGPKFLVRGIARPKAHTDARTPELDSSHIVETRERVNNIDEQEELLNKAYPDWVHFDTYLEEPE